MRRDGIQLTRRLRRWFYGVFGVLFLSGAGWLMLHTWGATTGEFGPEPHPLEPWLLRLHGAAAMAALVILGVLVPLHMRRGWLVRRNRISGASMVVLSGLLIITAYALYYVGGESGRRVAVWAHDVIGLGLPAAITWHVLRGRASRTTARTRPDA